MEPVALIVTALAAGVGSAAQGKAPDVVKSAYARLRDAVSQALASRPNGELALHRYEADPQAEHAALAAELDRAGVRDNTGLAAAALSVLELVGAAGALAGTHGLADSGSQGVQVGDGNWQVNYFVQKYIDQRNVLEEASPPGGRSAGRLLAEVTDPFALEVHRPLQADDPPPGLPMLPVYVPREHDRQLAEVVQAAANGSSGIAVLVGGSSTGKTRGCWEALRRLRNEPGQWRLWHPIDPTRPEAALHELPSVGPRTVVWLNEAQFYLDVQVAGLGERLAAGLRELLRDPERAPVLVLATLWPQFWHQLTTRPTAGIDTHAQARDLLVGQDISVPAAFTAEQLRQLYVAGDPRLSRAAEAAKDGQVIQFLAGAPELVARYRNAPLAARAVIDAAIDARRLGMGTALPWVFLQAAAPGYLTDADWDALEEDWLNQALRYAAAPCNGVPGPLVGIRPRPSRPATSTSGPTYRLADYLDQHGRRSRCRVIPPADFWTAATQFAHSSELADLADAAEARGLLRDAACLRKAAAAHGDTGAAVALVNHWHALHPGDHNAARWAAEHLRLDDPSTVAKALDTLWRADAREQVAAVADRAAAYTPLDNPPAVASLLFTLQMYAQEQALRLMDRIAANLPLEDPSVISGQRFLDALQGRGSEVQAAALAKRAAAHAPLDDPGAVASLLNALRDAGAEGEAAALAKRAAAHAQLNDPDGVAQLLISMLLTGTGDQLAALAGRASAHMPLDNPYAVAVLLGLLRGARAEEQSAALLARNPAARSMLDAPSAVAQLLDALQDAGAQEQAVALANRAATYAPVDDPSALSVLLRALRNAGADEQAAALADRIATRAPLDEPSNIAGLMDALQDAGAQEQAVALANRAAAHAPVDDPSALSVLLRALRNAGAGKQAAALADRIATHAPLDNTSTVARLLDVLQRAGAQGQTSALIARDPAIHTTIDDAYGVAFLLEVLQRAGGGKQARTLAARAAAQMPLDNPDNVVRLLDALKKAGAGEESDVLLARNPAAYVALDNPSSVAQLLITFQKAGLHEQAETLLARDPAARTALHRPDGVAVLLRAFRQTGAEAQAKVLADRVVAHLPFGNPDAVVRLLDALRSIEAEEEAKTLVDVLPAVGLFHVFCEEADHRIRYRFGREADGKPASSWGWVDLSMDH